MPDLAVVDRLIAVVTVLLLLSLLVQSIQALAKQMFKLKSNQIQTSLAQLFETALGKESTASAAGASGGLVKGVMDELLKLGRRSIWGRCTFDSIAKEDLLKILTVVNLKQLSPALEAGIQTAIANARTIGSAIEGVDGSGLPAEARDAFARLQRQLRPLLDDIDAQAEGNAVKKSLLVRDVLRLREVPREDVLMVLDTIRNAVQKEADRVAAIGDPAPLLAVLAQLDGMSSHAEKLLGSVQQTLSSLRAKVASVETWYDTVMQGFEERYQRGMRVWTFAISLVVVVALDAHPLDIYRAAGDPATMNAYLDVAQRLSAAQATPTPAGAPPGGNGGDAGTPSLDKLIADQRKEIASQLEMATTLGIGWDNERVCNRFRSHSGFGGLLAILSWLSMALMVWLGAPFWHDILESLFGIKRLVRKKAEDRNVEDKSGAGNPKP